MISPCNCKGSMQNVHFSCLQKWLETRIKDLHAKRVIDLDDLRCDICKGKFAKNY
jgi:E3 ubiquitin-protein ligase DOA10